MKLIDVWTICKTDGAIQSSQLVKASVNREEAIKLAKLKIQYPTTISVIFKKAGNYNPKVVFTSTLEILKYEEENASYEVGITN